jgi:hypothetical protein
MRTNHSLLWVSAIFALNLSLAGCDEKDDEPTTGTRDSNADNGDSHDDEEGEGEGESEAGGEMTGGGTAGTGGEVVIPAECQALCECIGMIGGDPNSCGMACGGAIADEDPNDRDQCLTYLSMAMYTDCNPECEAFGGGG